jgi:L-2,4-diaminobutyrate decarboxylase
VRGDRLNPEACPKPNQVDKSLQTTRRFDALKLWLTLRMLGADAIGAMFDPARYTAAGVSGNVVFVSSSDSSHSRRAVSSSLAARLRPTSRGCPRCSPMPSGPA